MRFASLIALTVLAADCRCQPPSVPSVSQPQKPPERPKPAEGTLDLYVDGALSKNVKVEDEMALQTLLPPGVRSVLLHGESAEKWLSASQVAAAKIGKNRRGMVKFFGGGSGEGEGGGGGGSGDIRGLQWVEVRTDKSPKLPGEPQM